MYKQNKELIGFGVWYKADKEDEGFGMHANKRTHPDNFDFMKYTLDLVIKCYQKTLEEEGKYDKEMIKQDIDNLEAGIFNFKKNVGDVGAYEKFKLTDSVKEALFYIMYGVYALEQQGVLESDNYNGYNFNYTVKDEELTKFQQIIRSKTNN